MRCVSWKLEYFQIRFTIFPSRRCLHNNNIFIDLFYKTLLFIVMMFQKHWIFKFFVCLKWNFFFSYSRTKLNGQKIHTFVKIRLETIVMKPSHSERESKTDKRIHVSTSKETKMAADPLPPLRRSIPSILFLPTSAWKHRLICFATFTEPHLFRMGIEHFRLCYVVGGNSWFVPRCSGHKSIWRALRDAPNEPICVIKNRLHIQSTLSANESQ